MKKSDIAKDLKQMAEAISRLESTVKSLTEHGGVQRRVGPTCSECYQPMVIRQNGYTGKIFYGCVSFPRCQDLSGRCMNLDCYPHFHLHPHPRCPRYRSYYHW